MTADEALLEIKQWLLSLKPELQDIPGDLDLVTHRIVDSLAFLDLTERLRELTGQEIDAQNIKLQSFQTLDAIRRNYLACLETT